MEKLQTKPCIKILNLLISMEKYYITNKYLLKIGDIVYTILLIPGIVCACCYVNDINSNSISLWRHRFYEHTWNVLGTRLLLAYIILLLISAICLLLELLILHKTVKIIDVCYLLKKFYKRFKIGMIYVAFVLLLEYFPDGYLV